MGVDRFLVSRPGSPIPATHEAYRRQGSLELRVLTPRPHVTCFRAFGMNNPQKESVRNRDDTSYYACIGFSFDRDLSLWQLRHPLAEARGQMLHGTRFGLRPTPQWYPASPEL